VVRLKCRRQDDTRSTPVAGVRFFLHFYTTDEELEIAFATVDEILRTDRWNQQAAKQTIVT
jgi:hypothetical protein